MVRHAVKLAALCVASFAVGSCQFFGSAPAVVKIGVIAPFEGVGRRLGYAVLPVMKSEVASVNGERALGDYRISLVALNDDLDPDEAAAQAKALAEDPDVVAVIGPWSDGTAAAAVPMLEDAGIPTLLTVSDDGLGPTTHSLCPAPRQIAAELLRGAEELNSLTVVLAGPDTALRRALIENYPRLALVAEASRNPCQETAGTDCTVIYVGDATGAADALRRWRAQAWDGPFLGGPDIARPWLIERAGAAAHGARAVICGHPEMPSAGEDVSLQYSSRLAGAATRSALMGLERAIADAGKPTRQTLASALSSFASAQDVAWVEVKNGDWVPIRE